jgi:type VI secretion system VasD/TssJ family lipoprotein
MSWGIALRSAGPRPVRPLESSLRAGLVLLVVLAAFAAALSAGCGIFGGGSKQAPPAVSTQAPDVVEEEYKVVLQATAKLNNCGSGAPNALAVRVYQLAGDAAIRGASLAQLWDREAGELGDELLEQHEFVLDPGKKIPITVQKRSQAKFFAAAGSFCETEGACWIYLVPFTRLKNGQVLTFAETCIVEAKGK